eukprot:6889897-Alexandrium_andersonii.AAC.1
MGRRAQRTDQRPGDRAVHRLRPRKQATFNVVFAKAGRSREGSRCCCAALTNEPRPCWLERSRQNEK